MTSKQEMWNICKFLKWIYLCGWLREATIQKYFQNKVALRSSHQDTFFNIVALHLWWNYLENIYGQGRREGTSSVAFEELIINCHIYFINLFVFSCLTLNINLFIFNLFNLLNSPGKMMTCYLWEYVHMRGEMNSYRFEISNRCENKFCSHEVSLQLHFKTTRYFDGHV